MHRFIYILEAFNLISADVLLSVNKWKLLSITCICVEFFVSVNVGQCMCTSATWFLSFWAYLVQCGSVVLLLVIEALETQRKAVHFHPIIACQIYVCKS